MLEDTTSTGTLLERLGFAQQLLEDDPHDLDALWEKEVAQMGLGLAAEAHDEFERDHLDRVLTDIMSISRATNLLYHYVHHLLENGRREDAVAVGRRMEAAREKMLASPDVHKRTKGYAKNWFNSPMLKTIVELPRLSRDFEKAKKPEVKEVIYSRDGILAVTYRRSRLKRGTDYGEWMPDHRWFDPRWRRLGSWGDGKLVHVLAESQAKTFSLRLRAPFAFSDEGEPRMFLGWEMKVDVPEPTIERMVERHPKCEERRNSVGSQASWLYDRGRYEEALMKYREARDQPLTALKDRPQLVASLRRSSACRMARCLIKLGRLDEADALLTETEAGKPDPREIDDPWERRRVVAGWQAVDVVRFMLLEARREGVL